MGNGRHLAEALRWSTEVEVGAAEVLAAGLGMAGPMLVAASRGEFALGMAASLGALAASGVGAGASARFQARALAIAIVPVALAALAAAAIAGHGGYTHALVVALALIASIAGGYSRPYALATMRFVMFLVIIGNVADRIPERAQLLALLAAGAAWTAVLTLLFGALVRRSRRRDPRRPRAPTGAPVSAQPAARRLARWKAVLAQPSGWQYTLRLAACLAIAQALRSLWPDHHLYWLAFTVVILTPRQVEALPIMTTQRALGTALGVLAASLFLVYKPPVWGMIACVGVLAGVRPLLKARNYLAYSAVMAPLILLLLDGSDPIRPGLLADRLAATLAGAGLVIAANAVARGFAARPGPR
ncbi:MAG: FUSC family protein [Proteobacteria bacterium]|nr:FUSC family protein [Pseudomonadota bacterium]